MNDSADINSVCVLGLGYIGLPTAAMLADSGVAVLGIDINAKRLEAINDSEIGRNEPGLLALVRQATDDGRLRLGEKPQPADVYLLAVPTPLTADQRPDLSCVWSATASIVPLLKRGDLLVIESTVPVGTCQQLANWLAEQRPDLQFPLCDQHPVDVHLAYCPERVLPGRILAELRRVDRIIGGLTPACGQRAAQLYRRFSQGRLLQTDARSAELVKLSENAFRDVNIAFANELSMICDRLGVDVGELIRLANHHPRVEILQPGCGVGGHCLAVDPWFIVDQAPQQATLIRSARQVNEAKTQWVLTKIERATAELAKQQPTIACYGLSYKADSDDLRESPALKIVSTLATRRPGKVVVVEPHLKQLPAALIAHGVRLVTMEQAGKADVLVRLVDHSAFKLLDWRQQAEQRVVLV